MQLYLVRHGVARDISEPGVINDVARPLSPQGEDCTRQVAAGLARLSPRISRVISSPLLRAMQTAEIFSQVLAIGGAVEPCDALASEQHIEEVIQWIKGQSDGSFLNLLPSFFFPHSAFRIPNSEFKTLPSDPDTTPTSIQAPVPVSIQDRT